MYGRHAVTGRRSTDQVEAAASGKNGPPGSAGSYAAESLADGTWASERRLPGQTAAPV
jgi:hypothetical protein